LLPTVLIFIFATNWLNLSLEFVKICCKILLMVTWVNYNNKTQYWFL